MTRISAADAWLQRGFTLLELLLVLGILGMLATLAVPALRSLDAPSFNAQVRQATGLLNNARRMAVVQGQTTQVEFVISDGNAQLAEETDGTASQTGVTRRWHSDDLELWYANNTQSSQLVREPLLISFFPEGGSTGGELLFRQNQRIRIVAIDPFSGRVNFRDE
ncbi:MAG: prepilin-type N-terminal cleavage/methylation domain-containing protein [Pseudohongiella sp.]|nr:prepilin-type N-terminal cleavage/methylation domain-containing protein [Pseudohongiella sp.]